MWKMLLVAAAASLLGGCAAVAPLIPGLMPSGGANAEFHTGTQVKLDHANFQMMKTNVIGECKGFSLLGIITIVPARFSTAMNRLYGQAEVQQGRPQTLVNVVVERSSTYVILYSIPKVSIRADVVEFVPLEARKDREP